MTTRDAKHAVRLQEWGQMVKLRQESGLTINEWCEQNSIKPSSYYYRLSQVRREILRQNNLSSQDRDQTMPTLVKIIVSPSNQRTSGLKVTGEQFFRLQYRSAFLDIPVGTRAEDITEVLKAMSQYAF